VLFVHSWEQDDKVYFQKILEDRHLMSSDANHCEDLSENDQDDEAEEDCKPHVCWLLIVVSWIPLCAVSSDVVTGVATDSLALESIIWTA